MIRTLVGLSALESCGQKLLGRYSFTDVTCILIAAAGHAYTIRTHLEGAMQSTHMQLPASFALAAHPAMSV